MFSLEEASGEKGDNIVSFSKVGEQLVPLDTIPSFGDHPCYLALSLNKNFVAVSNYSGGSFSFYILNQENKLEHVQTIQHEGSNVNLDRQESAHVHSTVFSAEGNFLLVAD